MIDMVLLCFPVDICFGLLFGGDMGSRAGSQFALESVTISTSVVLFITGANVVCNVFAVSVATVVGIDGNGRLNGG